MSFEFKETAYEVNPEKGRPIALGLLFSLRWDPDVTVWRGRNERKAVPVTEQIARLAASLIVEGFAVMVTSDEARRKVGALIGTY